MFSGGEHTGLGAQSKIEKKREHDVLSVELLAEFAKISYGQGSTLFSPTKLPLEEGDDKENFSCPFTDLT